MLSNNPRTMSTLTFGFTAQQIIDEGRITWEDINLLKKWLKNQNLPKLTDQQIVLFLLSCFKKQEATRSTIKAHYSAKNRCPEIFDDRDTERADLQKQLNTMEICVLPERTDDGCAIGLIRIYDTDYRNYEQGPVMKLLYMTLDAALYEHPPKGLVVIVDLKGSGIMHLTKLRLGQVKIFADYLQEGLPVALKRIHIFNTVYFMEKAMFILKPFIKKESYELFTYHYSNMDMELFYEKWLPKRCLPEDYGGDLPSVRTLHQKSIEKLKNLENYFEKEELQRRSVN